MTAYAGPQTVGHLIAALDARLRALEIGSRAGHTSLREGSLDILNADQDVVISLGQQEDGTYGLQQFDPATGHGVRLDTLAFGLATASSNIPTVTTLVTNAPLSPALTLTTTIGSTGRCFAMADIAPINTSDGSGCGVSVAVVANGGTPRSIASYSYCDVAYGPSNETPSPFGMTLLTGLPTGLNTFELVYSGFANGGHSISPQGGTLTILPF